MIIIKNNTSNDLTINDMSGVTVLANSTLDLANFPYHNITRSNDLPTLVSSGEVTLNDGESDLSIQDGLDLITPCSLLFAKRLAKASGFVISDTAPDPTISSGWNRNGDFFVYDPVREKWLGHRKTIVFTKDSTARNMYLKMGEVNNSSTGYLVGKDSTIVSITARCASGDNTKGFQIRNETNSSIYTVAMGSAVKYINNSIDANISANDTIRCFVDNTGAFTALIVSVTHAEKG